MDHQRSTTNPHNVQTSNEVKNSAILTANSPSGSRRRTSNIYALQVQAFIDAAEVVDVDADVIEDILDGFGDGAHVHGINEDGEIDVGPMFYDGEDEGDVDEPTEWDALLREAQTAWSKQEVKVMMKHLKELGMTSFIQEYVIKQAIPVSKLLYAFGICLCPELRQKNRRTMLYFLRVALSRELEAREKLPEYNTVDDAVDLIRTRKRILILTGAGISVSCGIPDFRSRNGLYASLQESGEYELDDPQQMFDIDYFRENPAVFYSFASKIYPSNFIPSPCHRFIKAVEDRGKLLRNYTQNIDTLETLAGVKRVLQCHGSFAAASCLTCKNQVTGQEIEDDILNHRVPLCKICSAAHTLVTKAGSKKHKKRRSSGWNSDDSDEPDSPAYPPWIMKPNITFFGEKLSDEFDRALLEDRLEIDLLIIIGTSLKVSPVSDIIAHLPHSVPQVLINKTPINHINPDIVLLGNADDIILHLCRKLDWSLPKYLPTSASLSPPASGHSLKKRPSGDFDASEPRRVGNSHVWLFEGAEGGKWVEELARTHQEPPESSSDSESQTEQSDEPSRRKAKRMRTG